MVTERYTKEEQTAMAQVMLSQLAGGHNSRILGLMLGVRTFASGDGFVQFKFKGCTRANICKITLRDSDLYDFELFRLRGADLKPVCKHTGLYGDMLESTFRRETGLDTHL